VRLKVRDRPTAVHSSCASYGALSADGIERDTAPTKVPVTNFRGAGYE